MNERINTMLTRRSIRSFEDKQVNEADIEQIVEAGLYAPSGMNCQTPIIIAITDKKTRKEIAEQNAKIMGKENCDPFYGAPLVLLVIAEKSPLSVYDGSCVSDYLAVVHCNSRLLGAAVNLTVSVRSKHTHLSITNYFTVVTRRREIRIEYVIKLLNAEYKRTSFVNIIIGVRPVTRTSRQRNAKNCR